jgi:plasmid maintenance system antidote protein VapI
MKAIEQVRRENLKKAIDELFGGNQTAAAAALGKDRPTQINHWLSGAKNISTPSARAIEEAFKLPKFWLDTEHTSVDSGRSITEAERVEIGKLQPEHAGTLDSSDDESDAMKLLPPELQTILTAYNEGGPAKQEALKRLAELPEQEMATLLLVFQSIGAKYKSDPTAR